MLMSTINVNRAFRPWPSETCRINLSFLVANALKLHLTITDWSVSIMIAWGELTVEACDEC
jgi:hypothetical protein